MTDAELLEIEQRHRDGPLSEIHRLIAELRRLRAAIAKHHAQHADDRCWIDDIDLYQAAGLPAHDATVGDEKAMLSNCIRFIAHRCHGGGNWKSYAELEDENIRLRAAAK